jgi:hypothetical protein
MKDFMDKKDRRNASATETTEAAVDAARAALLREMEAFEWDPMGNEHIVLVNSGHSSKEGSERGADGGAGGDASERS